MTIDALFTNDEDHGCVCSPVAYPYPANNQHRWTRGFKCIQYSLFLSSRLLQASCLPMSIIIVGVGPAEFDGKSTRTFVSNIYVEETSAYA